MMAIVERNDSQKYPPFVWATEIQVKSTDDDLEVSGIKPVLEEDYQKGSDPVRAYRRAVNRYGGTKRQGKNAPHVQFANADDPEKLAVFTKRFGPVLVSSAFATEQPVKSDDPFDFGLTQTVLTGRLNLNELERERLVYRAALVLVSELRRDKKSDVEEIRSCISTIAHHVSYWPAQWQRERLLRVNGLGFLPGPGWSFTQENVEHIEYWMWDASREYSGDAVEAVTYCNPVSCGHYVVCELLNAFPPTVYPWGRSPVEAPEWDISAGIRPLLYYMLRREYLGKGGIAICRNSDCRNIFEIERFAQEFCGEECSRLQRQREYWVTRGKKLRAMRHKKGSTGSKNLHSLKAKGEANR